MIKPQLLHRIKLSLKKRPLIYRLYFYTQTWNNLARNHLVSSRTDLCIEGFQSSGNSYLSHIIQYLRPDLRVAHHTHSIANICQALKHSIPTIVPIRMPSEAIASYVYRFHNSEVDECHLITYLDFYQYILKNLSNDHIIILPFDFLLDDLSEVLTYLSTQSQLSLTHPDLEMARNDVLTYMKVWPKIYGDDSDEIIALPTTSKEDQKVELREEVTSLAAYPQCLKIYRELTAEFSG